MVAVAIGAAAVVGAGTTLATGSKAAKAQKNAANQQITESRREYDTSRADYAPWRDTGKAALDRMASIYGLNPTAGGSGAPATAPDYSSFYASPDYNFRYGEGLKAIDRGAAASGLLHSGAAVKAEERFGSGIAAGEFGNYWNRLAGVAGVGQAATDTTTQAGMNATGQINNAYQQAGNARASSYANTGSAVNSGINNVLSAYLYSRGGGFGTAPTGSTGTTVPYFGNA